MSVTDTIEAEGHLIDSGLLSAIFDKIMNDPAFRNQASEQLMREVYERLRTSEGR